MEMCLCVCGAGVGRVEFVECTSVKTGLLCSTCASDLIIIKCVCSDGPAAGLGGYALQ